ncbi:Lrp/AsnC family transcriptional regulator [Streptomyces sp. NPDC005761]|uniref:Lrp/AsnC family transcriptional regulator n=1 Tax=unclassified Streptomyces TaxID=2593676 RepID=UPI0033CADCD4
MDHIDRTLLEQLQQDATQSYAALGRAVGLSTGAAHERVRKLREQGAIRRTTADVDPVALGYGVLAYVTVDSTRWMGDTAQEFAAVPEIVEAHIVAGNASVLVKVRTATTEQLQDVLRRIHAIDGVNGTRATIVLESLFERPASPHGTGPGQ